MHFVILNFQTFESLYTLLTMNKGVFRTSNSSQASQYQSAVCDFVKSEGRENEIINSAGNTPNLPFV